MKLIFMGTPGFAATILNSLLDWPKAEMLAVYTQPDRPAGRGRVLRASQVKQVAQARRLPVYQPKTLRDPEEQEQLRRMEPDAVIVAAYGLILPQEVLDIPRLGCINVHASLLPRYRGAAPIQRAIMAGEHATGITIMHMDAGLDTGDMLLQRALVIGKDDTAAILHDQLAELGGEALTDALNQLEAGTLKIFPQNNEKATYAAKLQKEEGLVDWNRTAQQVHNQVRALHPWPGAYFFWTPPGKDKALRLTLMPGEVGPKVELNAVPGTILGLRDDKLAITCADREYLVPGLIPEGKKQIDARSFQNGYLCKR